MSNPEPAGENLTSSPEGTVTVRLGPDRRVSAIEVTEQWDRECAYVEDLPNLVLDVIRMARASEVGPTAQRVTGDSIEPGDDLSERRAAGGSDARISPQSLGEAADVLRSQGGLTALLGRLQESLAEDLQATGEGQDPAGHVVARADSNGAIRSLTIDPDWSVDADAREVSDACTQAVLSASRNARHVDVSQTIARSPLGRLRDLTTPQ